MENKIKQDSKLKAAREINYVCAQLNRRIKQMNYDEESKVREFLNDSLVVDTIHLDPDCDVDYIASILDVNTNCIYDVMYDCGCISADDDDYDEDDEKFWDEQSRADDYNDERREGI